MRDCHVAVGTASVVLMTFVGCFPLGELYGCAAALSDVHADAVTSLPPTARANADPDAERELRAILNELNAAILNHDSKVIEKYYSPDYVMTFSSGKRGGFENSLHVLSDPTRNVWRIHDRSNERIIFYGSTAIATYTVHSQWIAQATQKEFDVREHVTQTWIRRDGRWTLIATHVTSIDPSQQ